MTASARIAVIGATGYVGQELVRLLVRHPRVAASTIFLRNGQAGVRLLAELFPQLRGVGDAACLPFSVPAVGASGADIVFLATPAEVSLELAPPLVQAGLRVVDLSGAFRFRSPDVFSRWYGLPAAPEPLLKDAVYGLPELYAPSLGSAQLVANPGCYATAIILGLRPLVEADWINRPRGIVCDAKSGVTGAGKQPKAETHFVEVNENFRAYGPFTHRHTPEIVEHLGLGMGELAFIPHLLPVERGILATLYVWLRAPRAAEEIEARYREFYAGCGLVRIWPAGRLPELQHVARTNFCDIGFALDSLGERLVIVSCLDNLGKGAAGQAIQNMNEMLGYESTAGLR
jgi:N-acetyl-gamma-glutamyl-phosphate reductase